MSSRDTASLILFAAFLSLALAPSVRSSLFGMLKIVFGRMFLGIYSIYFVYVVSIVFGADYFGFWETRMVKDTLLTTLLIGIPLLFRSFSANDGVIILRRVVHEAIGVSALVAFYVNLSSLSVIWELVFQILILVLGLMAVVAPTQPNVGKTFVVVLNNLLTFVGLFYLAASTDALVRNWSKHDPMLEFKTFAMSIWFPMLLLPFIYVFSFAIQFSSILGMMKRSRQIDRANFRVKFAMFFGLRLSIRFAHSFDGVWRDRMNAPQTFRSALRAMAEYRVQVAPEV